MPGKSSILWLNVTQGCGGFNDNLFKWLLMFFLIDIQGAEAEKHVLAIGGAIFVVPFLLFSDAGGVVADRLSKSRVIILTKLAETLVMVFGVAAFFLRNPPLMYLSLFLMASQSAFFGPAKYGIIPELVDKHAISRANSYLNIVTFFVIIAGTGAASLMGKLLDPTSLAVPACVAVAGSGFIAARQIPYKPKVGKSRSISPYFLAEIWRTLAFMARDRYFITGAVALSWFWLLGAFLQLMLIPYGRAALDITKESSGLLFLIVAFGIGVGSVLAGKLSGRLIELGLVPIGAFGIVLGLIALSLAETIPVVCVVLIFAGVCSGLFNLPLMAFMQWRSPEERRGKILAAVNFLNFTGILIASGLVSLCDLLQISARASFGIAALLMFGLIVWAMIKLPRYSVRAILLAVTGVLFRVQTKNIDRIPEEGAALFVCRTNSLLDIFLIMVTQQEHIRFVVPRSMSCRWWSRALWSVFGGIVSDDYKADATVSTVRRWLEQGERVGILAGGKGASADSVTPEEEAASTLVPNASTPVVSATVQREDEGTDTRSILRKLIGRRTSAIVEVEQI